MTDESDPVRIDHQSLPEPAALASGSHKHPSSIPPNKIARPSQGGAGNFVSIMTWRVTYFKQGKKQAFVFDSKAQAVCFATRQKQATKICETNDQADHFFNIPTSDLFELCSVTRKRKYRSVSQAEHFLQQTILHGNNQQKAYRWYACPHCLGWHLSSKPKPLDSDRSADMMT